MISCQCSALAPGWQCQGGGAVHLLGTQVHAILRLPCSPPRVTPSVSFLGLSPQMWWLKTIDLFPLMVPKAEVQVQGVSRAAASQGSRVDPVCLQLLRAAGVSWLTTAHVQPLPSSSHSLLFCVSLSVSYRTHVARPVWSRLEIPNSYICKDPFSKEGLMHRFPC